MWSRLDDKLPNHPKIQKAGRLLGKDGPVIALGFFALALSRANEYLTDGYLSHEVIASMVSHVTDPHKVSVIFTKVGLFEKRNGGYVIHDFAEWNPNAEQVRKRKQDRHLRRIPHIVKLG